MQDPRIEQLAQQLVRYSTNLKKGEKVLIDVAEVPDEIGIALIREARKKGAIPFLRVNHTKLNREMLMGANDAQYAAIAAHQLNEMQDMDAYIALRGSHNITELSDVPAKKMALSSKRVASLKRTPKKY